MSKITRKRKSWRKQSSKVIVTVPEIFQSHCNESVRNWRIADKTFCCLQVSTVAQLIHFPAVPIVCASMLKARVLGFIPILMSGPVKIQRKWFWLENKKWENSSGWWSPTWKLPAPSMHIARSVFFPIDHWENIFNRIEPTICCNFFFFNLFNTGTNSRILNPTNKRREGCWTTFSRNIEKI